MPRDGSGTAVNPESAVVTGTPISSTGYNATTADVYSMMTGSIAKDGQTTPSANLPMGTFIHTNVGNGSARNHYAALGQVQDGGSTWGGTAGGTGNAATLTLSPAITAYAPGMRICFIVGNTNSGNVTLNINGGGAQPLRRFDGSEIGSGILRAGALVHVVCTSATEFRLDESVGSPAIPTSVSGLGQIVTINPGFNTAYTLPAGGAWLAFRQVFDSSGNFAFAFAISVEGGGTTFASPGPGNALVGFAWRVA